MPVEICQRQASCKESRRRKTFETFDPRQVDTVEDHLKLSGAQLHAGTVGRRHREVVAALFETLAPQAQAVTAPVEHLEAVGRAIAENEQVSG